MPGVDTPRSYGDPCGIARALDRVGERWALLVVRELLLGPRRFTDLRAGLPGASPNVLSQRLDQLAASGVIRRATLPPPAAAAAVYELTPWGAELAPVLFALARWGSQAPAVARGELGPAALVIALQTTFDPAAARGLRAQLALVLDGEPFAARVARGSLAIERGPCATAAATIAGTSAALRAAVFAGGDLHALAVSGDLALAARFAALFRRPAQR